MKIYITHNSKHEGTHKVSVYLEISAQTLGLVEGASGYNRVKEKQLDALLIKKKPTWCTTYNLVYFANFYMYRAYLDPSSGGKTICI